MARLLAVGGLLSAFAPVRAAEWRLPALSGELHGQLVPFGSNGPRLAWSLAPATPSDAVRTLALVVEHTSLRLHAIATLDAATGDGRWRIEEGRIDVGLLLTSLAPALAKNMADITGEGAIVISGEGPVRNGQPAGRLKISWRDGKIKNAAQGWTLDGVSFEAEAEVATLAEGGIPLNIGVRTITTSRLGARNFSMNAVFNGSHDVAVKAARVEIAGGEVMAEAFSVPLSPPMLKVKLRMTRVGLQDVVALVPTMLTDARGRVDGEVELGWSEATGFKMGAGSLSLDEIEPMTLRLAPKPGFLTSRIPARFVIIAGLPEPFARWFAPENPAYVTLTEIELGKTDLRVQSLKVRLTPEGDGRSRSASVEVVARPNKIGSVVDKVVFTINLSGPLSQVLQLGMSDKISFGAH